MKFRLIIDNDREEEVVIYAKKESALTREIEALVNAGSPALVGYNEEKQIAALSPEEIICITIEDGHVFALTADGKWQLRERLYAVEEQLGAQFVKINQSCIANVKQIDHFDASLGGSLLVFFKNGYRDYVSRRQLKRVKERIGFRL